MRQHPTTLTLIGAISMNIYQPYTYLIGWSSHKIWYYGVRWKKNCNPSDLWNTYFTSSRYVTEFRKNYGEPDIISVRKVFADKESAKLWEDCVLRRLKLATRSDFLNKSNNNSFRGISRFKNKQIPWNKGVRGIFNHTEETKDNISSSLIGITRSNEFKKNISLSHSGRIQITDGTHTKYIHGTNIPDGWTLGSSPVINKKISNSLSGKSKPQRTKSHSENISKSTKGKSKDKVSAARKGGRHIYNPTTGISSYLCKDKEMPDGFILGRLRPT